MKLNEQNFKQLNIKNSIDRTITNLNASAGLKQRIINTAYISNNYKAHKKISFSYNLIFGFVLSALIIIVIQFSTYNNNVNLKNISSNKHAPQLFNAIVAGNSENNNPLDMSENLKLEVIPFNISEDINTNILIYNTKKYKLLSYNMTFDSLIKTYGKITPILDGKINTSYLNNQIFNKNTKFYLSKDNNYNIVYACTDNICYFFELIK